MSTSDTSKSTLTKNRPILALSHTCITATVRRRNYESLHLRQPFRSRLHAHAVPASSGSFHYWGHRVDWRHANRRTGVEFTAGTCRYARPSLAARPAPSVASDSGAGNHRHALWCAEPVRYRAVGARTTGGRGADTRLYAPANAWRSHAASGLQATGCGAVRDGAGAVGAGRAWRSGGGARD